MKHRRKTDPRRALMFWLAPTLSVVLLGVFLAGAYLGGNVNPRENLHDYPIAIVNSDIGATMVDGTRLEAGKQVAEGIIANIDHDQFDVRELSGNEAVDEMARGDLYGAIVIPQEFSARLNAWGIGALVANEVEAPELRIVANPRVGVGATAIMRIVSDEVGVRVNEQVGAQLVERVRAAAAESPEGAAPPSGTALAAAAHPLRVTYNEFRPLPDGTGNGLSAFYWTILIVLAGFTGAMMTSQLVDSRLGFIPFEVGPFVKRSEHLSSSRKLVLALKFAMAAVQAPVVAALYVVIGAFVGMPIIYPVSLWAFTTAMILAVGWVSHVVLAVLGNPGLIVNMIAFVILGLPSAGGTLPLEAVPEAFRLLGMVSPMHQIYLGTRSMLYLGGTLASGVGQALIYAAISVVGAIVVGFGLTAWFDRRGLAR